MFTVSERRNRWFPALVPSATPEVIRDNIGIPIELAVASADRIRGAEDMFKFLALGADAVGMSDGALIAAFDKAQDELRSDPLT